MLDTRGAISRQSSETELAVDFGHALLVLECGSLAAEDGVHFFKGETLGLGDEEPDESCSKRGDETEQDISSVCDALEEIGSDLTNDEVVHPVGRATESGTIWTSGQRPDFCRNELILVCKMASGARRLTGNQNPCTRTPGVSEMNDKQPDHDDCSPSSSPMIFEIVDVLGENDGDDEMGEGHAQSTNSQNGLATKLINVQDSGNCFNFVSTVISLSD